MASSRNRSSRASGAKEKAPEFKAHAPPKGYQQRGGDVVGFWDPDSGLPLHFIPLEAILTDNKTEPAKSSILILGRLVDKVTLFLGDKEKRQEVDGQPGDTIGVWGKPGMRALKSLAQVRVFMYPDGEKDTGKPNAMTTFFVGSERQGRPLPVTEDRRDKSRYSDNWLTGKASDAEDIPARSRRGREEVNGRSDEGDWVPDLQ